MRRSLNSKRTPRVLTLAGARWMLVVEIFRTRVILYKEQFWASYREVFGARNSLYLHSSVFRSSFDRWLYTVYCHS